MTKVQHTRIFPHGNISICNCAFLFSINLVTNCKSKKKRKQTTFFSSPSSLEQKYTTYRDCDRVYRFGLYFYRRQGGVSHHVEFPPHQPLSSPPSPFGVVVTPLVTAPASLRQPRFMFFTGKRTLFIDAHQMVLLKRYFFFLSISDDGKICGEWISLCMNRNWLSRFS